MRQITLPGLLAVTLMSTYLYMVPSSISTLSMAARRSSADISLGDDCSSIHTDCEYEQTNYKVIN